MLSPWPRTARSQDADAPSRIKVYFCADATASVTPWRQTLSRAVVRGVASLNKTKVRVMGEARCGADSVEFACMAGVFDQGGRTMLCNSETLLRLLRVAAWYAVRHLEHADETYEMYRERWTPPLGETAFSSARPGQSDADLEARFEQVRADAESANGQPSDRRGQVFVAILDMTLSALFGHEASHLELSPPFCAVTEHSLVEDSGLWTVLLRISSSDELYKAESPRQGEVAADRCATRRVRLERSLLASGPLSLADQTFVRRAAADIVSTLLLSRSVATGGPPSSQLDDAYLYPPLRIVALAGEIDADDAAPGVCGGAAENATVAAERTFKARPGKGLMPDEMEHAFPAGVVAAWERQGTWTPKVFACSER